MKLTVRGVVFSALFAALLCALSFFRIDVQPVPIVLENLVPMLAGALLGPLYGFFSMLLLVVLVAAGLPLLGGAGGIGILAGSSGGYVIAWPICALLIGLIVPRIRSKGFKAALLGFLTIEIFGVLFVDAVGAPWLSHVLGFGFAKTMTWGVYLFLPGDTLKAIVATGIWMAVRRTYPVSRLVGKGGQHVVKMASVE